MAIEDVPYIDPAPVPGPQRGDEATFDDRMDAKIRWDETSAQQFADLADNVVHNATEAMNSATAASSKSAQASTFADAARDSAIEADQSADAAAQSAQASQNSAIAAQGVQLIGTSNTSVTIGTGPKVLVTQSGRQWPVGVPIIAVNPVDPTQYMAGNVASYLGTSLTINVKRVGGVGIVCANWNISTSADQGAPGQTASNTQFDVIPVAALNLDLSLGNYFTKTVDGNSTFTFSNTPAPGFSFTLRVKHNGGVIVLPASVVSANSQIPTLLTGRVHLFMFATDDSGATWRMAINPNYPS